VLFIDYPLHLSPLGWAAFFLTLARRIAANIAKLPELLGRK
jgi:hypothetical protein